MDFLESSQNSLLQRRGAFTTVEEYSQHMEYSNLSIYELLAQGDNLLLTMSMASREHANANSDLKQRGRNFVASQMFAGQHKVANGGMAQHVVEAVERQHPPAFTLVPTLAPLPRILAQVPAPLLAPQPANNVEVLSVGGGDPWGNVEFVVKRDVVDSAPTDNCVLIGYKDSQRLDVNDLMIPPVRVEAQPEEHWNIPQVPPHRPLVKVTLDRPQYSPDSSRSGSSCEILNPKRPAIINTKSQDASSPPLYKGRLRWLPPLDSIFMNAVKKLGGFDRATPKHILDNMAGEDVTLKQVVTHLQKHRIAYREKIDGNKKGKKEPPICMCQQKHISGHEITLPKQIEQEQAIIDFELDPGAERPREPASDRSAER